MSLEQKEYLTGQNPQTYESLVQMGRETLRAALKTEEEQGIDAAFEGYEAATDAFKQAFCHEPTYYATSPLPENNDQIPETPWADPVVLLQYATCLARQAMSGKVRPYTHTGDSLFPYTAIVITNWNSKHQPNTGFQPWSLIRGENLMRIARETEEMASSMMLGDDSAVAVEKDFELTDRVAELTIAANKLAAAGIEANNSNAIYSLIEGSKAIADKKGFPRSVINELEEYRINLRPDTSAGLTIQALDELEAVSDLPRLDTVT